MNRLIGIGAAALLAAASPAFSAEPVDGYFKTSDGIRIHYLTLGDTGSPVVLIHGYTGNARGNWFNNGVAQALAKNHRVVAIDCRNHGLSDKPEPRGRGIARDVVELMDHLKIQKAHLHGYSMGGGITAALMAQIPERIITASFGGSGIRETDPELAKKAAALDKEGRDPQETEISRGLRIQSLVDNGATREEAEKRVAEQEQQAAAQPAGAAAPPAVGAAGTAGAGTPGPNPPPQIDLTRIQFPVIAIVGEFDAPNARTARMSRELKNFKLTVLPGKSHLTAISARTMPKEYPETLVSFIDANDAK
jgi:pimeloyl-ACP methyl ester carboxylesterase